MNNASDPHSSPWEGNHITARGIGVADAFQVPLVCFPAFENHFCGHEQECARVYRGTFAADNPLKFSEEVRFGGLHGRIVDLRVEDIKITEEGYRRNRFCPLTRKGIVFFSSARTAACWLVQSPVSRSQRLDG